MCVAIAHLNSFQSATLALILYNLPIKPYILHRREPNRRLMG